MPTTSNTMTAESLMGGYTRDQLESAFDLVKDVDHWKNPIRAEVPEGTDLELVGFAVMFFTGSIASIWPTDNGHMVEADGYYVAVGA